MSEDLAGFSRYRALIRVDDIRATLLRRRFVPEPLLNGMRHALQEAARCWLIQRRGPVGAGWPEREADFLRFAPSHLQDEYLRLGGTVLRLAEALPDRPRLKNGRAAAIDAASLKPWRETALDWTWDATLFVNTAASEHGFWPPRVQDPGPFISSARIRRIRANPLRKLRSFLET